MIRRGDIYALQRPSGAQCIVCVQETPSIKSIGVSCMVIGGNDQQYPPGSWDLFVFFDDLMHQVPMDDPSQLPIRVTKETA